MAYFIVKSLSPLPREYQNKLITELVIPYTTVSQFLDSKDDDWQIETIKNEIDVGNIQFEFGEVRYLLKEINCSEYLPKH